MSNSKVRQQLEIRNADKYYEEYTKFETMLLNLKMCKRYLRSEEKSMLDIIEIILKRKYNLEWQLKFIKRAMNMARGKTNALVSIPEFNYNERVNDILSMFVKKHFSMMIVDARTKGGYPDEFDEILKNRS